MPKQSDELRENWGVCGSVTRMGGGSFHHLLRETFQQKWEQEAAEALVLAVRVAGDGGGPSES